MSPTNTPTPDSVAPVAWQYRVVFDDVEGDGVVVDWTFCGERQARDFATLPHHQTRALYATPGVPVERVRALAEKIRREAKHAEQSADKAQRSSEVYWLGGKSEARLECADELDALAQEGTSNG